MRAPGPFRAVGPRRPQLRGLTRDLPLKAAALGVALVLWSTYALAAGRVTTLELASIPIERPEIPAGYVLQGQLGEVVVRLSGTTAAMAGVSRETVRATLDISVVAATRGEPQDARVRVIVPNEGVTVTSTTPASVSVRIEPITSRVVPVQPRYANEVPRGSVAGDAALSPAQVTISGPASAVAAVAAVYATVRFGDAAIDLAQTVQATAVDKDGAVVPGVVIENGAVEVRVPLLSTSTTRTLPVLWQIRGAVTAGYWISRVTADPPAITVRGEPAKLSALESISAQPIDVTGLSAPRTARVALLMPDGVAMVAPTEATITITVTALTGTRPFPIVAVQAAGLAAAQSATIDPRTVDVIVSGPVPLLAALTADAVSAAVDVSGRPAGTYQLDVTVRVPQGITLQSVQPARVTVTITNR